MIIIYIKSVEFENYSNLTSDHNDDSFSLWFEPFLNFKLFFRGSGFKDISDNLFAEIKFRTSFS